MTDAARATGPFKRPALRSLSDTRLAASTLLSDDDRRALDDVAPAPRPFYAGDQLVPECAATDHLHFVVEGWALQFKTTPDGEQQVVGLVLPGDLANIDSLLFDRPDFGVRAITRVTAVPVPRDRLLALAAERPGIARALTWTALVENAGLIQWAFCLGRQGARERLAHLLCELAVRLGRAGDAARFDLPMTQEHLADALGLTAVHVNRVLQRLRADRLIATASRSVTVPDTARLRELCDFDPAYLHMDGDGPAAVAGHPVPAMAAV